jgi:hypothetical protein
MGKFEKGVKDESWDNTIGQSVEAEDAAIDWLTKNGRLSTRLPRRKPIKKFPDDGDLLTYMYNEYNQKYWFRTVDVKRNSHWIEESFPHPVMLLTTVEQPLHQDWVYMSFSADLVRVAIFDMSKINLSAGVEMETTNRRGGLQMSVGLPFRLAEVRLMK